MKCSQDLLLMKGVVVTPKIAVHIDESRKIEFIF